MFSLEGKKVLVTGASGGIGSAIAKCLHAQGAEVALSGTRVEALEALSKELGTWAHIFPCNLSDAVETEKLIPSVEEKFGKLDILVNNAGLTRDGLLMRMKDEDWQKVIEVNLTSIFRLCRSAIRGMMKNRAGRIINISSIVGVTGNPGQTNYVASKAGLIGFSKALAQEVASRSITVNCVAPGFIPSPMTDELNEDQKARIIASIPMGKMGDVKDIAAAVAFLASEEAGYITGQTLHVNGGMAMI